MHNDNDTVGKTGEFATIDRIVSATERTLNEHVLVGPGDDAAVLATPDGRVVISTDVFLEGEHFRRAWSSAADIGHRVVASAVADIAAMGATPTGIVVALACPADLPISWLDEFSAGVADECRRAAAALLGGDVSGADKIYVTVTAFGDLGGQPPVLRSGAQPGDDVAVIGALGHAAAGLAILSRGFRSGKAFIDAHRRPQPPYSQGAQARAAGAHAMCDVSDGLLADLGHIANASDVRIDVRRAAFTIPPRMVEIASALGADPYEWILAGGEDHALVATFTPGTAPEGWIVVGQVLAPAADSPLVTIDSARPEVTGWTHFDNR